MNDITALQMCTLKNADPELKHSPCLSKPFSTVELTVSIAHQPSGLLGPSNPASSRSTSAWQSQDLRLHTEPPLLVGAADSRPSVLADRSGSLLLEHEAPPLRWIPLDEGAAVGGGSNLSHHTPNTSVGYVQATPSRVLPSPTVNTQEAFSEFSLLPTRAPAILANLALPRPKFTLCLSLPLLRRHHGHVSGAGAV